MTKPLAVLLVCSVCASAFVAAPALAQEPRRTFDIPSQDAAAALREYARQSGRQVLFPFDAVSGRRSPALRGNFTARQAADRLAAAVGLAVRSFGPGLVSFAAADVPRAGTPAAPATRMRRTAPPPPPPAQVVIPPPPPGLLQQVIVTATRRDELLNRVPISLSAMTGGMLDQQSVRHARDMQASVPALVLSQLTPSLANVAIRGISDTGSGAATTGFYLDDTPLQKRNAGGVRTGSGNGTPLPPLFDVERVEVLRGPQGTLFGAGSEGGTIRYITAQPSLDRISVYGRAEASATSRGDPSGEIGLAVGAPLVRDRLGVRIAAYRRHTGGFLDYLDPFTGAVRWPDANWGDAKMLRAAVQWAPRDDLRATVSVWSSNERWASATSAYTPSMRAAIVVPTLCFNTRGITPASPQNNPAPVPCSSPGVTYVRPAQSYGPFPDLGPGKSLLRDRTPSSTNILIPSLTLQYEGPAFTAKSITSYVDDQTRLTGIDNLSQIRDSHSSATYGDIYIPRGFTLAADYADAWRVNGHFQSLNKRYGVSQEVRLTSRRGEQRLAWVAGVFYSNLKTSQAYNNVYEGLDQLAQTLYGISAAQRYGVGPYLLNGVPSGFDHKDQTFQDVEVAAFGEADYRVAERLRLIFGLRVSRLRFDYTEHHYGPASGFNVPTPENGGGPNSGTTTESPVAPKLGAVYEIDPSNLVYLTAAKGFRAGGVNAILPAAICGPGLAQYGLQPQDVPPTYASDSVWSYELGGKFRLWRERVQLNLAAYRIDWRDAQLNIDVGNNCGIPFTGNAGTARSQGMEIEAQARLAHDLTADLAIGYDDARYTADAVAVRAGATPLVVARKDQRFAVPPWTVRLGARYDFRLGGLGGYARLDGFYTRRFQATAMQTFGLPAYAPDARSRDATRVNARLALQRDGIELALFASNIFNSSEGLLAGGRSGCALPAAGGGPACASYGTYNPFFTVTPATWPRQVGVQVVYRR